MCLEAAFSHLRSEIDLLLVLEMIARAGSRDSETRMVEVRVARDLFFPGPFPRRSEICFYFVLFFLELSSCSFSLLNLRTDM